MNQRLPKVSVIIPVYNEEKYLEECLDSVCNQSLRDIEIICVDDGSTDGSLEILSRYAAKDARFKVFAQHNQFAGMARNLGMEKASGKYLAFLDSDDFFSEELLMKMYNAAERYGSDIVICDERYFDESTKTIRARYIELEHRLLPEARECFGRKDAGEVLFQLSKGWAWDKLFRADFVKRQGLEFAGSRTANDGYFVYMAMGLAERITKLDDVLVTQRINNARSLVNTRSKSWQCGFQMLEDIKNGLTSRGIYENLEHTFLNFALEYIAWSYNSMKEWGGRANIYDYVYESGDGFGILARPKEYYFYPGDYDLYQKMTEHSFAEYMAELLGQKNEEIAKLKADKSRLEENNVKKCWPFPFGRVKKHSGLILYGPGNVGRDYYRQIKESGYCQVLLWLDRKFEAVCDREEACCGWWEELSGIEYDQAVIAMKNERDALEAQKALMEHGVEKEKIIWKV